MLSTKNSLYELLHSVTYCCYRCFTAQVLLKSREQTTTEMHVWNTTHGDLLEFFVHTGVSDLKLL